MLLEVSSSSLSTSTTKRNQENNKVQTNRNNQEQRRQKTRNLSPPIILVQVWTNNVEPCIMSSFFMCWHGLTALVLFWLPEKQAHCCLLMMSLLTEADKLRSVQSLKYQYFFECPKKKVKLKKKKKSTVD